MIARPFRLKLRGLLNARSRISVQLYAALGAAVALTFAASLVGIFSFDRVGDLQSRINEGSVPELAAAFGVASYSGTLVAAGPRLTSAATREDIEQVSQSIHQAHLSFEEEVAVLEELAAGDLGLPPIREAANTLILNLEAIEGDRERLYHLEQRSEILRTKLQALRHDLDHIIVPGIDAQFFYAMTGYGELGQPPSPRADHFSEAEIARYRHLAEMQSDGTVAIQLLASAFNLSDPSSIEPLRERFISANGRVERSLTALEDSPLSIKLTPIYQQLFDLGLDQGSGFDLLTEQLTLVQRQGELLAQNRDIGQGLVGEVNALVAAAETSAAEATQSSAQAIFTGRILLISISAISIAGALLISWLFVGRVLLHRLELLSNWMRRMAGGDLESQVEVGGRDEIADMAAALEIFRRHALEVQRLNLVEQLAGELQGKNDELEAALNDLSRAQDQIVMQQKLAALGELTAGVAHEIRNPLNFVKNFSESSQDLLDELKETLEEVGEGIPQEQQALVQDISGDLVDNLERIRSHGERADRIVNDMLMMGRGTGGQQMTDLNRLLDQNARLAYHSARALDSDFQLDIQEDLDEDVGELSVVPQDLGRVFLNMVANACDATGEKRASMPDDPSWQPVLKLATRRGQDQVEIRIRDNGSGIPPEALDKIFNPFFTTKPTDKGTGLGLAISSDIIRQHGGAIRVDTGPGQFTEMIIELPLTPSVAVAAGAAPAPASLADPV